MANRFIGIDVSTQSCKGVCINTDSGKVESVHSINYDRDLPSYGTYNGVIPSNRAGLSESDPIMWLDALQMLFRYWSDAGVPLESVKALSVSGQQHGLVAIDEQGRLTRTRSKLWNDVSTEKECRLLTDALGGQSAMIEAIGNTQRPGYTAGKIFHMYRHEPRAARATKTFFLVHNFINWYLTGGKQGGLRVMEPGDVSGMALCHPGTLHWSERICGAIAPDLIEKLPPVKPSDKSIGYIGPDLVQTFGFSPGCRVDAGSGDNMYGAVGTGNIRPGIVTISLGTSGTIYTILDEPWVDAEGEIALFCDSTGRYLPLLCVSNMANGYMDFLQQYGYDHDRFQDLLQKTTPGNNGRMLMPWYESERTPDLPKATAVYWGFNLNDFNEPVLGRAVLEGHILNLYDGFRRMPVQSGDIRLTGGLAQSDAWGQTIADVFNTETVPVNGEGAALGAAIHAAWVYQKEVQGSDRLEQLCDQFVELQEERRKYPMYPQRYEKMKAMFHEVSLRLRKPYQTDAFEIHHDIYQKSRSDD